MHFSWERMPQLTQVQYQYEVSSKEGREKDELCFTHHGHRCNIYRNANLLTQKSLKEQTLDVFTHIHTRTHAHIFFQYADVLCRHHFDFESGRKQVACLTTTCIKNVVFKVTQVSAIGRSLRIF